MNPFTRPRVILSALAMALAVVQVAQADDSSQIGTGNAIQAGAKYLDQSINSPNSNADESGYGVEIGLHASERNKYSEAVLIDGTASIGSTKLIDGKIYGGVDVSQAVMSGQQNAGTSHDGIVNAGKAVVVLGAAANFEPRSWDAGLQFGVGRTNPYGYTAVQVRGSAHWNQMNDLDSGLDRESKLGMARTGLVIAIDERLAKALKLKGSLEFGLDLAGFSAVPNSIETQGGGTYVRLNGKAELMLGRSVSLFGAVILDKAGFKAVEHNGNIIPDDQVKTFTPVDLTVMTGVNVGI